MAVASPRWPSLSASFSLWSVHFRVQSHRTQTFSRTQAQRKMLMTVSRCSGFFDYRGLLRASLSRSFDVLPEQLFLLFVENLLGGFRAKVYGGEKYVGELWSELKKTAPKSSRDAHISRA